MNKLNLIIIKYILAMIIFAGIAFSASAQFFYDESCRYATGIFQYHDDAVGYTAGLGTDPDPDGEGWLRLTIPQEMQIGYVVLDGTFPSSMGVTIEFDFKIWTPSINYPHNVGDGFCVFLFDGDPTKTFQIGEASGSLGYRNLSPAYLGVGISEIGSFTWSNNQFIFGAPGIRPHAISVADANYYYKGGTEEYLGTGDYFAYPTTIAARPTDAEMYRRLRIEMQPISGGMSVSAYMKMTPTGNFEQVMAPVDVIQPTPSLLRLGFSGVTGGSWAYHEVRDVIVRTPGLLSAYKSTDNCPSLDNVTIHTVIANGMNTSINGITVNDTLPAGFVIAGMPTVTSGTMSSSFNTTVISGNRTRCTYTIDAPANANVRITFNGSFAAMPASEQFVSSVGIAPPSSIVDANTDDNHASVTGTFDFLSIVGRPTVIITGNPVTLEVIATNSTDVSAYAWTQSSDNGTTWTPLPSATTQYTYTGSDYTLVRCAAEWTSGCRDTVVFSLSPAPDNISDATCFTTVPATVWGIQPVWSSSTIVSTVISPMVGDLDNDSIPEIVCWGVDGQVGIGGDITLRTILIYNGRTHDLRQTIELPPNVNMDALCGAAYGLVKIPYGAGYKGLVVVACKDFKLRAYDIDGHEVWTTIDDYGSGTDFSVNIGFADFNGDNHPEVYVRNKIYDAETGYLLGTASGGNNNTGSAWAHWSHNATTQWQFSSPIAADVVGDQRPELILGNEIYDVDIISRESTTNPVTMIRTVKPAGVALDGHAQVADFNNDGHLDVFISSRTVPGVAATVHGYVWDVYNNTVSTPFAIPTTMSGKSIPLIADMDKNGNLDVLIQCGASDDDKYRCLEYDATTKSFNFMWGFKSVEDSFSNTATLFDFNLDGDNEVLLTDQTTIRILNAATGIEFSSVNFIENTFMQYPVIADVDADGSADIVAVGSAQLNIFKSSTAMKWAPARKVWNQYMYNAVNINEDLTVPAVQFNPATIFPGVNGLLGDNDDVRPYNNFLQQQTILNTHGTPLLLAPDATYAETPEYHYYADGDSLVITLHIKNSGDAGLQSPFYVSAYKNTVTAPAAVTVSYPKAININETISLTLPVHNFSNIPLTGIIVRLNDSGMASYVQTECDIIPDNEFSIPFASMPLAHNDHVSTIAGIPMKIDVLANDNIPAGCSPTITVDGSASVVNDSILYTSSSGFAGYDTLTYHIACGANTSTAYIYIYVAEMPDNISDADCYIEAPEIEWKIREIPNIPNISDSIFSELQTPLAGDIDGDGMSEILITVCPRTNPNTTNSIAILDGNGSLKKKFQIEQTYPGANSLAAIGRIKYSSTQDTTVIIVLSSTTRNLYAYNSNGVPLWTSDQPFITYSASGAALQLADLDGDGWTEIVAGNKIFAAESGRLLCTTGSDEGIVHGWYNNVNSLLQTAVGDVLGVGNQQVCIGNTVYAVNIVDRNAATNIATPVASISPIVIAVSGSTEILSVTDGATQLADIDLDGHLDIIVSTVVRDNTTIANSKLYFYIWSPYKNKIIASKKIARVYKRSVPFVGDIDGDGYPEIVLIHGGATANSADPGYDNITTLKYNPLSATGELDIFWQEPHDDVSGATGITLFDFNQDGISELVYRDSKYLRIINGSKKHHLTGNPAGVYDLATIECRSGTAYEYPIVVDTDNDGEAEIVIVGYITSIPNQSLRIFKSGTGTKWAPARKVWNQYSYNAINVNEDLTIPRYPMNPATVFPGKDGRIGTADDIRPYNAFLQQQTAISKNGLPFWLTSDVEFAETPVLNYYADGDSLVISTKLTNTGDAALIAPFYVSVYKNTVATINKIAVDSSMTALNIEDTMTVTVTIRNLSPYYVPSDNIIIRINDRGMASYVQPECDTITNNRFSIPFASLLLAHHDHVSVIAGIPMKIDVLANDSIPAGCSPTITVDGSASVVNDSILYTSSSGFAGYDTLTYQIACGANTSTAYIYIYVAEMPDNISDADCYIEAPAIEWKIREVPNTLGNIFSALQTPLAGDIDGDGMSEILMTSVSGGTATGIAVLNGNGTLKNSFSIASTYSGVNALAAIGRIKYSSAKDTTVIIALSSTTLKLYAYNRDGTPLWPSDQVFTAYVASGAALQLADIDGDGWTEIIAGNKIFAAESGRLLCTIGSDEGVVHGWAANTYLLQTAVGDVMDAGKQQVCIGNTVYAVNIVDRNAATNIATPVASISPVVIAVSGSTETLSSTDGATQLADIDLDGHLDIVVSTVVRDTPTANSRLYLYVWSPYKNKIIASKKIARVYKRSVPFIGDIDGDGYPEIVLIHGGATVNTADPGYDNITTLKYNPLSVTGELDIFWQESHNDTSGATGITLFDFNQDGISELVYRDNENLRIINGSKKNHLTGNPAGVYDLATIECRSATTYEYPIVADTDNDGEAEIIIVGHTSVSHPEYGSLRIFKSGTGTKWAPARKVWNQYSYNAINVNEDLTIPRYPMNPATVFPGKDGRIGTADDIRPYNAFLQQQTAISKNGLPFWLTPDAKFAKTPVFNYYADGDSLVIPVSITNTGDAALVAPFYVSVYKNTVAPINKIAVDSSMTALNIEDTTTVTVTILNFSGYYSSLTNIIVRINDRGEAKYVQPECDTTTNNGYKYPIDKLPIASNDTVAILFKSSVTIAVKVNDTIPGYCAAVVPSITSAPANGVAGIVNDSIKYTPANNFYGVDSLVYRLTCSGDTVSVTEAKVYITVNKPISDTYIGCIDEPVSAGFEDIADVEYYWYNAETEGIIDAGSPENTHICTAPEEWWVEVRYKGTAVRPRFHIVVDAYPKALFDYPDIRIRVCPNAGSPINLSKYLDTLLLYTIEWKSISPHVPITGETSSGTILTSDLKMPSTYTFTYTVSNPCATDVTRKVYLEKLKSGRMRPLRDTIKVCYLYTEALQINQLFGIEAEGEWEFAIDGVPLTLPSPYISTLTSPTYNGAIIMNGLAIFEASGAPTKATRVTVTYTPDDDSCLKDNKPYSIEIMLTEL
jgi:hypothetical protein